jgi:hypothetical protein
MISGVCLRLLMRLPPPYTWHHESGHCVLAYLRGVAIKPPGIGVYANSGKDAYGEPDEAGICHLAGISPDFGPITLRDLATDIAISMAGPVAGHIYLVSSGLGMRSWETMADEWGARYDRRSLSQDELCAFSSALAWFCDLRRTLRYLSAIRSATEHILRAHWPTVQNLANYLGVQRSLSADEVTSFIQLSEAGTSAKSGQGPAPSDL